MKKIELKLTADQIVACCCLLEKSKELKQDSAIMRMFASVSEEVHFIFNKKHLSLIAKEDLFNVQKKYKMSLKYHEACVLYWILESGYKDFADIYNCVILDKIRIFLHHKII